MHGPSGHWVGWQRAIAALVVALLVTGGLLRTGTLLGSRPTLAPTALVVRPSVLTRDQFRASARTGLSQAAVEQALGRPDSSLEEGSVTLWRYNRRSTESAAELPDTAGLVFFYHGLVDHVAFMGRARD
jgi:hypothetical protein